MEALDCSVSIVGRWCVRTVRGVLARLAGSKGLGPLAVGPLLRNTRGIEALLHRRRARGERELDHEGSQDKVTVADDLALNARRRTVNQGLWVSMRSQAMLDVWRWPHEVSEHIGVRPTCKPRKMHQCHPSLCESVPCSGQ